MNNTIEIGTPINSEYKVGDVVFLHHLVDNKIVTTIGFLV